MDRQREREQFTSVAEVASEAFVTIDDRSVIRSVNPAVEEIFGYKPDDYLGSPSRFSRPTI